MNKKEILVDFLLRGLKGINEITENIDFQKTSKQFIQSQLPTEINNSFLKIQFPHLFRSYILKSGSFSHNGFTKTPPGKTKNCRVLLS